MLTITSVFAVLLVVILLVQAKWANQFVDLYRPVATSKQDSFPHVGVVMSLRGADPFLESNLRGLMSLEYPSHEIRIIIDSEADPAFALVERIRRELRTAHVEIELLNVCQETSSLKNSALIQGINGCSSDCEAFAWLDSDTIPHCTWLQDLMAPLQDENVGAACGIRWYAPPTTTLANYVRHIWNGAALLQMVAFEIGWGGAFAIRKAVYTDLGLEHKWGRALFEDTLASNEVLRSGRRVRFVAACTMQNPESSSLSWCLSFVTRQLLGLRYYHTAWRTVMLFGLMSGIALLGNAALLVGAIMTADFLSAMVSGTALLTFGLVGSGLFYRSDRRLNAYLGDRAVGGFNLPLMILAALIAQLVHLIALVRVCVLNEVTWRGIRYRMRSGMDVTRINYAPYVAETDVMEHSL